MGRAVAWATWTSDPRHAAGVARPRHPRTGPEARASGPAFLDRPRRSEARCGVFGSPAPADRQSRDCSTGSHRGAGSSSSSSAPAERPPFRRNRAAANRPGRSNRGRVIAARRPSDRSCFRSAPVNGDRAQSPPRADRVGALGKAAGGGDATPSRRRTGRWRVSARPLADDRSEPGRVRSRLRLDAAVADRCLGPPVSVLSNAGFRRSWSRAAAAQAAALGRPRRSKARARTPLAACASSGASSDGTARLRAIPRRPCAAAADPGPGSARATAGDR